jgi:SAM-dependent MidA family methyltransferase
MLLPAMGPLESLICQEIDRSGPIPFARFMELALYCPELGYYDRFPHRIGATGDFYTSVSVGPVFGRLLANQFARWLNDLDQGPWQLIEAGAHDGQLAYDLLDQFQQRDDATFERLEYLIIEPSPTRRHQQRITLAAFARKIRWVETWADPALSRVQGIIFGNELLDAFPVHRIGWDRPAQSWFEWGVQHGSQGFYWTRLPLSSAASSALWPELCSDLLQHLPDQFTTEVCPAASAWWRQAAGALHRGRLLTLDYGFTAPEFFDPGRARGTLRAYRGHYQSGHLLEKPGHQDLTAHVNFSAIRQAGEASGLLTEHLISQERFLTSVLTQTAHDSPDAIRSSSEWRQFQTLTHPEHLGTRYRVLVQLRDASASSG